MMPPLLGLLALLAASPPELCRQEILLRALAFSRHPWVCTEANTRASCHQDYRSDFHPGLWVGLPYDWGGHDDLGDFDRAMAAGRAAGSHSVHGALWCSAGQDCSGFVSRCWKLAHHSTASLWKVASDLEAPALRPGDAFNLPGVHVVLFGGLFEDGWPLFFEATGSLVQANPWEGWAAVEGYQPIRRDGLLETCPDPFGTLDQPLEVPPGIFTDLRDTRQSQSQVLDFCGAAPEKHTRGPEYLYRLQLTQPTRVRASLQDDGAADIDLALYRGRSSFDCVARDDRRLDLVLDCGDWLLAADTFSDAAGNSRPGSYILEVETTALEGPCHQAPPKVQEGRPGEPCQRVGENQAFCNPNTGATCCLELPPQAPFCTLPCQAPQDCLPWFPGGCCLEASPVVGPPGSFCVPAWACAEAGEPSPQPSPDGGGGEDDGGSPSPQPSPDDGGSPSPQPSPDGGGGQDGGGGPSPRLFRGGGGCAHRPPIPPSPPGPEVWLLALGLLGLRLCANLLCWSRRSGGAHAKPGENGRRDSPGLGHWQGPAGVKPGDPDGRGPGQERPLRGAAGHPQGPDPGAPPGV